MEPQMVGFRSSLPRLRKAGRLRRRAGFEAEFNRMLLQATPAFFVAIQADGRIARMNRTMLEALGYLESEVLGQDYLATCVAGEDRPRLAELFEAMVVGRRPVAVENWIVAKDGRKRLVQWRGVPLFRDDGFAFFFGVGIDVTEQRRMDRELMASQARLDALLESTDDLIWSVDLDCRLTTFNTKLDDHLQRSYGTRAFLGALPEDLSPPDHVAFWRPLYQRAREDGPFRKEFELPDGRTLELSLFPILQGRESIGVSVFGKDISERKQYENEKQRLKNYLSNIIDSMPSMLVGLDEAGLVSQWNLHAQASTGIPPWDAIGRPCAEILPRFGSWIDSLREEVRSTHAAAVVPKVILEEGGSRRVFDLMMYPLVANGVQGAVLRIEEVTERTRVQEMLIQTEKMISLGGLAAGMAHEINNPLGIITQAAQNIARRAASELPANRKAAEELGIDLEGLRRYYDNRQIPQFIASIQEAVARASTIVANMLQFSRHGDSILRPEDLAEVAERALDLAANDFDLKKKHDFRGIEIVREFAAQLPRVPLIRIEIEQVLLNLLKNAAQALDANPPGRRPQITLRLRREEKYAVIEVEDNGPGIDEAHRRRIFEPFFTTKEAGAGTGLGLSVSYAIITQNHRGLMELSATGDEGTCFTIRLPLPAEDGHA
jgi:PAS domain S-box-containing protein